MTEAIAFSNENRAVWDAYVKGHPGATIAHPIGWKDVMEQGLGHRSRYLIALDGDQVRGVLPLVLVKTWWRSRYLISLPWIDYGGILADDADTERLLLEKARQTAENDRAEFVEFRSVHAGSQDLPLREDKVTFVLDLDADPEIPWKAFNAKLRNQIRKAQKSDVKVEFGRQDRLNDFYKVFAWKMRDLGTPVWGREFFNSILTTFDNPDSPVNAKLVLIRKDDDIIAGGLLLAFKDRLYVPSAASYRSALKYCPNHALYWEVIKKGCEKGYREFDFGRSTIDGATYKFKIQWVPEPRPLTWQYYLNTVDEVPSLNPDNSRFDLLIRMWRKLPLPVANFLGPKVIRNFP